MVQTAEMRVSADPWLIAEQARNLYTHAETAENVAGAIVSRDAQRRIRGARAKS